MRRKVGVVALIGLVFNFVAWMMLIFTGACFANGGFSIWVPIIFLGFVICMVLSIVCWAKDVLCFIGRCLGLRQDDNLVCMHCGRFVRDDSKFCPSCGKEIVRGER